ncbi:MAG: hypothetical protein CMM00_01635 [Rhodopirellula sp.]|nr:hypothetical protein [Rhodopirellula sp.]
MKIKIDVWDFGNNVGVSSLKLKVLRAERFEHERKVAGGYKRIVEPTPCLVPAVGETQRSKFWIC